MRFNQRAQLYQASNVTFNPQTKDAFSYGWWRFVAQIEGKLIFDNFPYSNTTRRHQWKVHRLMAQLNLVPDLILCLPKGIPIGASLSDLILEGEETLCDAFLREMAKSDDRNTRAKRRRLSLKTRSLETSLAIFGVTT